MAYLLSGVFAEQPFLVFGCYFSLKNDSNFEVGVFRKTNAQVLGSNVLNSKPNVANTRCTSLPKLGATSIARISRLFLDLIGSMYLASCRAFSLVAVLRLTSTMTSLPFLSSP